MTVSRRLSIGVGAAALGVAGALGVAAFGLPSGDTTAHAAPAALHAAAQPAAQDVSAAAAPISRRSVILRANTWHPHSKNRIPYSQKKYHGGYRTDCSGYVSMALGLSKPGPNTVALASRTYSNRIRRMSGLLKGDLVIDSTGNNNTRHVVIFEKWVRNSKGKIVGYWAYEQRGHYGTDHRILTYGLSKGSQYHPYRPKNIR
ncbi:hypothetical protein [Actinoallomurus sp. CA-150999]|uniref:hypothetical protein n=1 Tax=Actinoallomurus sp. CA-150999 TaxID=3239887 RepID=UPI003D8D9834